MKVVIKPLDVVLVNNKLCVKVLKFNTLKNDIMMEDESFESLLAKRTIITDLNKNLLNLKDVVISAEQKYKENNIENMDFPEYLFREYLDTKKYKVYIILPNTILN